MTEKDTDAPMPTYVRVTRLRRSRPSRIKTFLIGENSYEWDAMYADGVIRTNVDINAALQSSLFPADFWSTYNGAIEVAGEQEPGRWVDYPYGRPADVSASDAPRRTAHMDQIISFMNTQLRFLIDDGRYQVVDALETAVNGSNSVVVFASKNLQYRFTTDRDQLLLDLRPGFSKSAKDWYSIDLVRRMFLGERELSGLLDASFAEFLRNRVDDIEQRFDASEWPTTKKDLDALKRLRTKEMLG